MSQLIIPAAKLVPEELQGIGKLPPIIYPINQKLVFDYLVESYVNDCSEIDVICYEQSAKVRRRLSSYKIDKLNIKDLPILGDLGRTIHFALENLKGSVIINFADTIVMERIQDISGDAFFYAKDEVLDKWTYFEEKNGIITNILDKSSQKISGEKSLFVGVFKISDAVLFHKCLDEAFKKKNLNIGSFYYALTLYSQHKPMTAVYTDNWFDIGHIDRYNKTQIEVKAREFNHILIDRDRGILKKSSDDKDKFIGEILWYLKLPTDIEYVRPRIFSYSTDYNNPYVSMEYYAYHTIHELFLYGDLTCNQWRNIYSRIQFVCNDFKRYSVKDDRVLSSLVDMYLNKTVKRLESMKENPEFRFFFKKDILVNGVQYISLDEICNKLKEFIPQILFDIDTFHIIHGDLCFANIMVDSNYSFIKVIDPRGKFGSFDIYGDPRYEIAKLLHSVDGKYDFIIKNLFNIEYDLKNCKIDYHIIDRVRDYDLYQLFCEVFKEYIGNDLKKIELIEALLFLSMIPLHTESIKHQMAMLATGIEILNRVIEIERKKK